jgi:hypothetical protein
MGNDSARMRLRFTAPSLRPRKPAATAPRTSAAPRAEEKTGILIRYVATTREGSVSMSPAAVSMGAAMLSMSQPRATDSRATRTVIPSKSTPAMIPPAVEITM